MDTATKTGIDAARAASKRVVQKTAEATGDFIGNKIVDKTTPVGKSKEKGETKESRRNFHPTRKKATKKGKNKGNKIEIVLSIKSDFHCIKMELQEIVNLLYMTFALF